MDLSNRLKSIRKLKKMTQKQVAEYLGISTMSYSRYEQNNKNSRTPDIQTLSKLSKLFNVGEDYFFDDLSYYNDFDEEFEAEFYSQEMDQEFHVLQSALSTRLELEKKARKLINRFDSIIDGGSIAHEGEMTFIKSKLGSLFVEIKNVNDFIDSFGVNPDIEDAIIEVLNRISKGDK